MKDDSFLLLIDAIINLGLGILLVFFPGALVSVLGIPSAESAFYPSILGAVLIGIGLALLLERSRGGGLGLGGAIAINLCAGVILGLWLLLGELQMPLRGQVLLWCLVALLVGISTVEWLSLEREGNSDRPGN